MAGLAWTPDGNGTITLNKLHVVPNFSPLGSGFSDASLGSNLMREDAARQLSGLMQAFWKRFKKKLLLSEGYRPLSIQNKYWDRYQRKLPGWTIAALPKTSIHGWGLSADLAIEGVGNPSGEYLQWLRDNAGKYGFVNDVGAEPWHWSYRTDMVTKSITINVYISNPNQDSLAQAATGGNMFILFEHAKRGQALGGPGFFHGLTPEEAPWAGAISYVHIVCVNERHFDLIKAMCTQGSIPQPNAGTIADAVWKSVIEAPENGKQPALARLAGADLGRNISDAAVKKIVAALPKTSGGTAGAIDEDRLASKVADLLAKRLQS